MASRRGRQKEPEVDLERLEEASNTELVQICRQVGELHVGRHVLREDLIALILGEAVFYEDVLADWRKRTFAFVTKHRRSINVGQMDCDFYCPSCPHNKVIECWADNHEQVAQHAEAEST